MEVINLKTLTLIELKEIINDVFEREINSVNTNGTLIEQLIELTSSIENTGDRIVNAGKIAIELAFSYIKEHGDEDREEIFKFIRSTANEKARKELSWMISK